MPFTISCACGKTLQVREDLVGKKVRCPACQAVVTVPPPTSIQPEAAYRVADEAPAPKPGGPPPLARRKPEICHEIDYEIFGDDLQLVEVELDPDETVIAEAGAMTYMEADIEFTAKLEKSPRGEYELTDAIRALALSGKKVQVLELTGDWADVRDPEVLAQLNAAK